MRDLQIKDLLKNISNYSINYKQVLLKEFFIKKVLYFLYTNNTYKDFVFTWWTCLRILYKLPKLSEDIDMDIFQLSEDFSLDKLIEDLKNYCEINWWIKNTTLSKKSWWRTILIKLPILKKYWLVPNNPSESENLYIKIDTSLSTNPYFDVQVSPYFNDEFSIFIKHYDLPSLFAWKLSAIFGRNIKTYHDEFTYKWRDFFDLIRYLQNKVKPNFERLQFELKNIWIQVESMKEFVNLLDDTIEKISSDWIYKDLVWLIENDISVKSFSDNFKKMYSDLKNNLL